MTWFDKRKKDKDAVVVDVAMMEDVEKAASVTAVPYHPGAAKYFKEKGFTVATK